MFLISCSKNESAKLSKDEMVDIIIRIHLAEAKVSNSYLPSDSALMYYKTMEDSIFGKYNTTKKVYDSSYVYYMKNIEEMDIIYSRVVDSLSLKESLKKI